MQRFYTVSFKNECKGFIPSSVWNDLEKVGRNKLHPKLLLGAFDSKEKSRAVSRLPIDMQEKAINGESFDIALPDGNVVKQTIYEAKPDSVKIACTSIGIRKPEDQQILQQRTKIETTDDSWRYINAKRSVRFVKNEVFNKKQLLKIAEGMSE